jgi:hypothetical protein
MALAFDSYIFHYGYSEYGLEKRKADLIDRGLTTVNGIFGGITGILSGETATGLHLEWSQFIAL